MPPARWRTLWERRRATCDGSRPDVVEEIVDTLRRAGRRALGRFSFESHKVTKTSRTWRRTTNKTRIATRGLPAGQALQEPQEPTASTPRSSGRRPSEPLTRHPRAGEPEPGVVDALEEARRAGSDDTKRKAKGALWMIMGEQAQRWRRFRGDATPKELRGHG